jgi:hypothetical protein
VAANPSQLAWRRGETQAARLSRIHGGIDPRGELELEPLAPDVSSCLDEDLDDVPITAGVAGAALGHEVLVDEACREDPERHPAEPGMICFVASRAKAEDFLQREDMRDMGVPLPHHPGLHRVPLHAGARNGSGTLHFWHHSGSKHAQCEIVSAFNHWTTGKPRTVDRRIRSKSRMVYGPEGMQISDSDEGSQTDSAKSESVAMPPSNTPFAGLAWRDAVDDVLAGPPDGDALLIRPCMRKRVEGRAPGRMSRWEAASWPADVAAVLTDQGLTTKATLTSDELGRPLLRVLPADRMWAATLAFAAANQLVVSGPARPRGFCAVAAAKGALDAAAAAGSVQWVADPRVARPKGEEHTLWVVEFETGPGWTVPPRRSAFTLAGGAFVVNVRRVADGRPAPSLRPASSEHRNPSASDGLIATGPASTVEVAVVEQAPASAPEGSSDGTGAAAAAQPTDRRETATGSARPAEQTQQPLKKLRLDDAGVPTSSPAAVATTPPVAAVAATHAGDGGGAATTAADGAAVPPGTGTTTAGLPAPALHDRAAVGGPADHDRIRAKAWKIAEDLAIPRPKKPTSPRSYAVLVGKTPEDSNRVYEGKDAWPLVQAATAGVPHAIHMAFSTAQGAQAWLDACLKDKEYDYLAPPTAARTGFTPDKAPPTTATDV